MLKQNASPIVIIKKGKAKPFWHHHPWVYSGAIFKIEGNPRSGDVVTVVDHQKQFIARGFFDEDPQIRVRLFSWKEDRSLEDCLERKITSAIDLRNNLLKLPEKTTAYRLLNSEGDGCSGIIIDQYEECLVLQYAFSGMERYTPLLWEILKSKTKAKTLMSSPHLDVGFSRATLAESNLRCIAEYGVRFYVDLAHGQKTGFYCDQRENRHWLTQLASPKRVLDVFCYTGGFGVHLAAKTTPKEIIFLDDSKQALEAAKRNLENNSKTHGVFIKANAFREMERLVNDQERFDTIILDPPKLAPNQKALPNALRALVKLNANALKLLEQNGILTTCECSGDISIGTFMSVIQEAALIAKRELTILKIAGAGPDHPIHPACPEGAYLKVLFCRAL